MMSQVSVKLSVKLGAGLSARSIWSVWSFWSVWLAEPDNYRRQIEQRGLSRLSGLFGLSGLFRSSDQMNLLRS